MKITMYELLGMVKDKKIPKKIMFNDCEYLYHDKEHGYCRSTYDGTYICMDSEYYLFDILNDEVEILEEEKKIPEKLKIEQDTPNSNYYIRNENGTKCGLTKHSKMIAETLNQVIDYLKSKGE